MRRIEGEKMNDIYHFDVGGNHLDENEANGRRDNVVARLAAKL